MDLELYTQSIKPVINGRKIAEQDSISICITNKTN